VGAFLELLDLCISTVRLAAEAEDHPTGTPSYNVLLTLQHMYVFPRRRETHVLSASHEPLSVNALGFAGLLLVKSPAELDALVAEGPVNVLRGVGYESVHELQVAGGPELDGDVGTA